MAYGYAIKNGNGWSIVDEQSKVYYPSLSGASQQVLYPYQLGGTTLPNFGEYTTFNHPGIYFATDGFQSASTTDSNIVKPSYASAHDDLCFWQLGTEGLVWISQLIIPRTLNLNHNVSGSVWRRIELSPNKIHYAVNFTRTTSPNFFIISRENVPANLPGSYGLQINNADGSVAVDSRKPLASISHVHFLQASVLDNVLNNNAVVDITLPFSIPNCYVHAPMWKSFKRVNQYIDQYSTIYFPRIRQTSPTNLRIDRVSYQVGDTEELDNINPSAPGSFPFYNSDYYFDCPLFISRGYPL